MTIFVTARASCSSSSHSRITSWPDSIGAVLDPIEKTNQGKGLFYPCDAETSEKIKGHFRRSWSGVVDQIVIVHQMDIPSVKDIPNQVKNRILDWALELERAGIHGEGHSFMPIEQQRAKQIVFNDYSTKIQAGSVQGGLQVGSPHATQNVMITHNEIGNAIRKIYAAVDESTELDDIDKQDMRASLDLIRDLAGKKETQKCKLKITEKLTAISAAVDACTKLALIVKPVIALLKEKLHIA